jgi:hypothetical protein
VAWHYFKWDDREAWLWSKVMPGDMVQTWGTLAYKHRDFIGRDKDTEVLSLRGSPILCLSRHEGIPGEEEPGEHRTFVCLSRHGIVLIVLPRTLHGGDT